MANIQVLDETTINKIAAGEVVERPSAVVKELIENSVDAGATAITVEIKEGGLSLIRITDNGSGIDKDDIPVAFLRHATSKIRTAEDLLSVTSLGFRGEALSSVAAVAQVELITKTEEALHGYRYLIEGGIEKSIEEIGCPRGTTIIIRNLFYNTPARRKFLKSPITEAGYVNDLMERLMVSHPSISFKFIVNGQVKLQSSGNNNSKDILYQIYGREIAKQLLPIQYSSKDMNITGFIGKPVVNRGNRNYENYYINGRYIKSNVITRAIEEAYKPFLMQHKYPFTTLYITMDPSFIDVNVHPQKMEIRLKNGEEVYSIIISIIREALTRKEMIPKVVLTEEKVEKQVIPRAPEPFEENRRKQFQSSQEPVLTKNTEENLKNHANPVPGASHSIANIIKEETTYPDTPVADNTIPDVTVTAAPAIDTPIIDTTVDDVTASSYTITDATVTVTPATDNTRKDTTSDTSATDNLIIDANVSPSSVVDITKTDNSVTDITITAAPVIDPPVSQISLFADTSTVQEENFAFLSQKAVKDHKIIGQVFSTYWLVEYKQELFIIDQHAAHQKVLYEKMMAAAKNKTYESQMLLPPIVITLNMREQETLRKYDEVLKNLGYEIEPFGGNEFSVRAVPIDFYGLSEKDLLLEFIDDLTEDFAGNTPNSVLERVASLSCKAAVKANHSFSVEEATTLIKDLLELENPYHCPHGRPVIISMSKYELEKKFKRIL